MMMTATNKPRILVDSTASFMAIEHLKTKYGLSHWSISVLSRLVARETVDGVVRRAQGLRVGSASRVSPSIEQALLSIEEPIDLHHLHKVNPKFRIDAFGQRRRIGALMRLGHTMKSLSARLPYRRETLNRIYTGFYDLVEVGTALTVNDLYERLCMTLPAEPTTDKGRMVRTRTIKTAVQHGYPPPLAWRDGEIDLPYEWAWRTAMSNVRTDP